MKEEWPDSERANWEPDGTADVRAQPGVVEGGVELPATAYAPNAVLDEWIKEAEAREEDRHQALLAQRLRCSQPGCEELGVWFMVGCVRGDGTSIPDNTAYCVGHPGGTVSARPGGFLSLNYHGWLPDGTTWRDGFPRMDDTVLALAKAPWSAPAGEEG